MHIQSKVTVFNTTFVVVETEAGNWVGRVAEDNQQNFVGIPKHFESTILAHKCLFDMVNAFMEEFA